MNASALVPKEQSAWIEKPLSEVVEYLGRAHHQLLRARSLRPQCFWTTRGSGMPARPPSRSFATRAHIHAALNLESQVIFGRVLALTEDAGMVEVL
jgi:hypothetical protein